jgi:TPR repeat protein
MRRRRIGWSSSRREATFAACGLGTAGRHWRNGGPTRVRNAGRLLGIVVLAAALSSCKPSPCSRDDADQCERKCKGGNGESCARLAVIYYDGALVPRDYARARGLFERSCEIGVGWACGRAGNMYNSNLGGPRDTRRGFELLDRGCKQGGAFTCCQLGGYYLGGEGVPEDRARAVALATKPCNDGLAGWGRGD